MDNDNLSRAVGRLVPDGDMPAWLKTRRMQALAELSQHGLPTTAAEDWRYTDLAPVIERITTATMPRGNARVPQLPGIEAGAWAVFVDGVFRDGMSTLRDLPGIAFGAIGPDLPGAGAPADEEADGRDGRGVQALKTALLRNGIVVDVKEGARLQEPLHLAFLHTAGSVAQNQVTIRLGAGSAITVVEHHLGDEAAVATSTTTLVCGPRSHLSFIKLQGYGDSSCHLGSQHVTLGADAAAGLFHLDLGARLARNDLQVELQEPGAEVDCRGLFFADESRHLDNHTRIDHRAVRTRSRETYRGIMDGNGRGVFNGRIVVHPAAARADARLTNQNLLLSPGAEIDTKPELEIYADDVRCSHGATTGQLDRDAVFYLRSRGIPADEARRLLIASFTREILRHLPAAGLEDQIVSLLEPRLPGLAAAGAGP
ncbi:MAG: Fe-S cluster assembly protein SufD [Gammaproteobacteria bacterium]|nr:Fe-S cluster assembly protein SufD [Gammaproteobacteria bacterium]